LDTATQLPDDIKTAVDSLDGSLGSVRAVMETDVGADGGYGSAWLVVADKRVLVYPSENGAHPSASFDMESIKSAAVTPLVGVSAIELTTPAGRVELVRYSNAKAKRFAKVCKVIDALADGRDIPEDALVDDDRVCPTCKRELPEDTDVCPACVRKSKVVRRLLGYARPYIGRCVLVFLLMVTAVTTGLVPPYLTRYLVDHVLKEPQAFGKLGLMVLALTGSHVLGLALSIWRGRVAGWLGNRLVRDLRAEVYRALNRLSMSYFDKKQVGAVMARVIRDTGMLADFLIDGALWFMVCALEIIGIGVVLFCMDWKLALLILIPAPVISLVTYVFWRRIRSTFHKVWHQWSAMNAALNDTFSGIRVVKAFAQEQREVSRLDVRNDKLFAVGARSEQILATFFPLLYSVGGAGFLLVWYFGGHGVQNGGITLGTLMAFLGYLGMFYGPLQSLSRMGDWLSRCLTSGERIFEVIDTEPEAYDDPEAVEMPEMKGRVEIKDVRFSYDPGKKALDGISIDVAPGEMIGLVGHSGAGKSTLINLICRFYDVDEGAILIDGVDVRKIRLHDLRRQIGIVMQEPFLFPGTIAENIAYGKPEATLDEIMAASRTANAHDFIMKSPYGYDTEVGERGKLMSGGERQRISIARAILHDPKILILDEATSSVDLETEKNIQEALARLTSSRTTFAIAHRLSTLRNANRLLVLEKGKVAELGSHDELVKKRDGVYAKLAKTYRDLSKLRAVDG